MSVAAAPIAVPGRNVTVPSARVHRLLEAFLDAAATLGSRCDSSRPVGPVRFHVFSDPFLGSTFLHAPYPIMQLFAAVPKHIEGIEYDMPFVFILEVLDLFPE